MPSICRRLRSALFAIHVMLLVAGQPVRAENAAPAQQFDILEFQVEGNRVLNDESIERAVYPSLGEGRTIDDVEAARATLEKAYRDAGYATVSVDIPPQKVVGGTIVLHVVEGRIARLRVTGSRYYAQQRILAAVPALVEGEAPRLPDVQRQLAAVNISADKRVTPLLRPGKEAGTTEVDLQVEDQLPLHGSVELNNHNAPHTSAARLAASLRYGNLFQRDHVIGVQFQTAPERPSEVRVLAGSYTMPAADGTLAFNLLSSHSSSYVGGGIGVFGQGSMSGMRYVQPVNVEPAVPGLVQTVSAGFDYKDFKQNLSLTDGTGLDTPIRYLPITIGWSGLFLEKGRSTEFGAGFEFAVRGVASRDQQFADKRYEALSSFSLLKFNLGQTRELDGGYALALRLDGQLAGAPLVSNEQFVAGGADSVRGYLESSQTGDSALRVSLEWRRPWPAPWGLKLDELRLHAFFDAAGLWQRSALPGTSATAWLASAGVGFSARARGSLTLRSDLALPLHDTPFQKAYRPRLQASGAFEF